MCPRQRIRTQVESSPCHHSLKSESLVLQDGELIVLDQQEYLVIGERTLTVRISCSVVAGNATIFQENSGFLRIAK